MMLLWESEKAKELPPLHLKLAQNPKVDPPGVTSKNSTSDIKSSVFYSLKVRDTFLLLSLHNLWHCGLMELVKSCRNC